jgi:type II secretory pathway pseudopilin PulG
VSTNNNKLLVVVICIGFILLGPLITKLSYSSYVNYATTHKQLSNLQDFQQQIDEYNLRIKEYSEFSEKVDDFLNDIHTSNLYPMQWQGISVNFSNRPLDIESLYDFSQHTQNTKNYYFLPNVIQLTSTKHDDGNEESSILLSMQGQYLIHHKL